MAILLGSAVLIVAVFVGGLVVGRSSAQVLSADAHWWQAVTDDSRADVVHGGIDAYEDGWMRGSDAEGLRLQAAANSAADAGLMTKADAQYVHDTVFKKAADGSFVSYQGTPSFSKTFGAYEALIDNFYGKHPAAAKATFGSVMSCLVDKVVSTCDQIAKWNS